MKVLWIVEEIEYMVTFYKREVRKKKKND